MTTDLQNSHVSGVGSQFYNAMVGDVIRYVDWSKDDEIALLKKRLQIAEDNTLEIAEENQVEVQKCSFCDTYINSREGVDPQWKCGGSNEFDECDVWCENENCHHNLLLCDICDYAMCPDHTIACAECNLDVCEDCNTRGNHKCAINTTSQQSHEQVE